MIELRAPNSRDIECFYEIFSDESHHFIIDQGKRDLEQSREKLRKLIEINGISKRVYTVSAGGEAVGFVVIHLDGSDCPFISYAIRRSHWRRGFAGAAIARLVDIEHSRLAGFHAATHLDNHASQELLLKCDFEKVGVMQHQMGERVLFKFRFAE